MSVDSCFLAMFPHRRDPLVHALPHPGGPATPYLTLALPYTDDKGRSERGFNQSN
jgi:hypothetical protein